MLAQQRGAPASAASAEQLANSALEKSEILTLLDEGDAAFQRDDLATARLFYQRAIEAGEGRGALGMGATYDPFFLRRFRLWTQHVDLNKARSWYLRARDLGAAEADARLAKLKALVPR